MSLGKAQGVVENGGQQINTQGLLSTDKALKVYASATVTVYETGTLTLATIFSDLSSTPKANPFTADSTGFWFFYAENGSYDVKFSGGGLPAPVTRSFITIGAGGSSGGSKWGVFNPQDFGAVGDGVTNDTSAFTDMLTAIGSNLATIVIPNVITEDVNTQFLLSNLVFPFNTTLDFFPNGGIKIVTGQTVQILGRINAEPVQIFFNADSVVASQGEISLGNTSATNATDGFNPQQRTSWLEWWGAVGNDVVPSAAHANAAFLAMPNGTTMRAAGKFYFCETTILISHKFQITFLGLDTEVGIGTNNVTPIFVYHGTTDGEVVRLENVYASTFKGFGIYTNNGNSGHLNDARTGLAITYVAGGNPSITSHCYFEGIFIRALNANRTDWIGIRIYNTGGNNEQHTIQECNIEGNDSLGTDQIGISMEQTQIQRVEIFRCSFSSLGEAIVIQGNIFARSNIFSAVGTLYRLQSANNNSLIMFDDAEVLNNIVNVVAINGQFTLDFIGCKYNAINTIGNTYGDSPINNAGAAALTFEACTILSSGTGQNFGPFFVSGPPGDPTAPLMFINTYIGTSNNFSVLAPGFATCATAIHFGTRTLKFGGSITTGLSLPLTVATPTISSGRDLFVLPGPTATTPVDPVTIAGAIGIAGLYPIAPYQISAVGSAGSTRLWLFSVIALDAQGRRSGLMTLPNGDHFFLATWNSTLSGTNYLHLEWFSMFPTPDHFAVYEVNTSNTAQWRFVSDVAVSGGAIESYNVQANPAGAFTNTMPDFNEAGIINLRNLMRQPSEYTLTVNSATPSVAKGNRFVTSNSVLTRLTTLSDPLEGQLAFIRVADTNTVFGNTGTMVTGTGADENGVLGAIYLFEYASSVWRRVSPPLARIVAQTITGTTQSAAVNASYIPTNASLTTITLPATAAIGDVLEITGRGSGGWVIAQNASQVIHINGTNTTVGTGGSLASSNRYNCVFLRCVVANTDWVAVTIMGTLSAV